jgi:hypothetical protein
MALALLLTPVLAVIPALAQAPATEKLRRAIAVLRGIDVEKMTEAELDAKADEMSAAWELITSGGDASVPLLLEEIRKVDEAGEQDHRFKLAAAALLWATGGLDQSAAITRVWDSTPLTVNYNYVFYTAFEAAMTQDPRVLPMLKACLRDKDGSIFVALHAMPIRWPLTHESLWGSFGPKGIPAVAEVLKTSQDPVELRSSIAILSDVCCLDALPRIREIASRGSGEVRRSAVRRWDGSAILVTSSPWSRGSPRLILRARRRTRGRWPNTATSGRFHVCCRSRGRSTKSSAGRCWARWSAS